MAFKYFPQTDTEIQEMLRVSGVNTLEELYKEVPDSLKLKKEYSIPSSMSEIEIRKFFQALEAKNQSLICFAGAGAYDHYTPSIINYIINRSEFQTSYTPYQAEISQGTLQYIFEFQSLMADLTGMEISNASMYDGCTATAEAMMMAVASARKKDTVLISSTVHPRVCNVVRTYAKYHGVNIEYISEKDGKTDLEDLKAKMAQGNIAAAILPQPNYYGIIEDLTGVADICHAQKALFIMHCNASSLAVLKSRAFVLTMQAREQHIRREKATSNICSNQGLMTLFVSIYLSLMGKKGMQEINELSYSGAHYLYDELIKTGKFEPVFDAPFLYEFCVRCTTQYNILQKKILDNGILGGIPVEGKPEMKDCILFAVTEKRSKAEIDKLIKIIKEA